jgi:hypothetical protein
MQDKRKKGQAGAPLLNSNASHAETLPPAGTAIATSPAETPQPLPEQPAPQGEADLRHRAYDLYIEHQKQAWTDCQSGSDEFDKNILTYSSAGLGISLVFIKDIVPLSRTIHLNLLYSSWILFGLAILVTISSFQLSVKALEQHLEHLRKYYLERQPQYLNAPNRATEWVGHFKWISGGCFVLAIIGTIFFSISNLAEARHMTDDTSNSGPMILNEGRKPMSMTPLDKGRQPMGMTPIPSNSAQQQQPPSSSAPATPPVPAPGNLKK